MRRPNLSVTARWVQDLLNRHDRNPDAHQAAISAAVEAGVNTPLGATYAASGSVSSSAFITIGAVVPTINVGGMYDGGTLTYTIVEPGLYELGGSVAWDARPAAANHILLTVYLSVGGGAYNEIARFPAPGNVAAAGMGCSGSTFRQLAAGDKVQFRVYQDCGSTVTARHMTTLVKFLRAI